jgi:hypothetical protein
VKGISCGRAPLPYKVLFEAENKDIHPENTVFWDAKDE